VSITAILLVGLGLLAVYSAAVLILLLLGRRTHARALAGFVPDCAILLSRLLRDPCVPRRRRWVGVLLVAYLSSPIDLIPDFIPVVGYLDDAVIVVLMLRWLTRDCGQRSLKEYWPGPAPSLGIVLSLACVRNREGPIMETR
jgi:uncharacterized membrane protein YkvA (DUF1232 family)